MNKTYELNSIMFKDYPDCVNMEQLQKMLGVKRTKAYQLIKNGEINAKKVGKEYKISKLNVIAFMLGEEQLWTMWQAH